jgi:hypothetical protein
MMALVGVNDAGDTAESTSAFGSFNMMELSRNYLLGLSHNECDDLGSLFLSDIGGTCSSSDNLDEYLAPLLSSLHMFTSLLLLHIFIAKYFSELLIILVSVNLFELALCSSHKNLILDTLCLPHVLLLGPADFLSTLRLRDLPALVAPLLHFFSLKFSCPLVSHSTFHGELRLILSVHEESEGAFVALDTGFNRLIDQETVVAEAHVSHLVELLITTIASHLSAGFRLSLPSLFGLTNSGEWLLMWLSLLDLIIILVILLLVSGVHLRGSRSIG